MKSITMLMLALFGSSAMALDPVVLEVKQRQELRAACPICEGGTLVTETQFKIQDTTCSDMTGKYEISVVQEALGFAAETVNVVRIAVAPMTGDCEGPTRTREYYVETDAIEEGQPYILANPTVLKPQRLAGRR